MHGEKYMTLLKAPLSAAVEFTKLTNGTYGEMSLL